MIQRKNKMKKVYQTSMNDSHSSSIAVVGKEDEGERLHKYIRSKFETLVPSKRQAHDAFKKDQVRVNGSTAQEGYRLVVGDTVSVHRRQEETIEKRESRLKLDVKY
jgi:ribosomal 50S subunit-recycling heat shock protein